MSLAGPGGSTHVVQPLPAAEAPKGENHFRITWIAGQDRMVAICHCGAELVGDDPVELWAWLLEHPDHPSAG